MIFYKRKLNRERGRLAPAPRRPPRAGGKPDGYKDDGDEAPSPQRHWSGRGTSASKVAAAPCRPDSGFHWVDTGEPPAVEGGSQVTESGRGWRPAVADPGFL